MMCLAQAAMRARGWQRLHNVITGQRPGPDGKLTANAAPVPGGYPTIAEEIRTKQGASSRQKLDAKQDDLSIERGKTKVLRSEVEYLKLQVAKLASINEMLSIENQNLALRTGNSKIASYPVPRSDSKGVLPLK